MSTTRLIYAIALIAVVLTALSWIQVNRIDSFADDLQRAQLEACERNNILRDVVRVGYRNAIANLKNTDSSLFPDIPLETFRELQAERLAGLKAQVNRAMPIGCESVIPDL